MGFFGFAEIVLNLEKGEHREIFTDKVGRLLPSKEEFREAAPAAVRGTILGSVLGVLPGGGALLSSFASYSLEKKLAKDPSRFGKGAVAGVAGPESANNVNNNVFDVYMTAAFSVVGYVFHKLKCEPAPLLLGFILGPMMEENLRRAMLLSRGDPMIFLTRPLSVGLLIAAVLLLVIVALPAIRSKRDAAFVEEAG